MCAGTYKIQKRTSDPLETGVPGIILCLTWVLGSKIQPSKRALRAFKTSGPPHQLLTYTFRYKKRWLTRLILEPRKLNQKLRPKFQANLGYSVSSCLKQTDTIYKQKQAMAGPSVPSIQEGHRGLY